MWTKDLHAEAQPVRSSPPPPSSSVAPRLPAILSANLWAILFPSTWSNGSCKLLSCIATLSVAGTEQGMDLVANSGSFDVCCRIMKKIKRTDDLAHQTRGQKGRERDRKSSNRWNGGHCIECTPVMIGSRAAAAPTMPSEGNRNSWRVLNHFALRGIYTKFSGGGKK